MGNVNKSVAERTHHQRQYDRRARIRKHDTSNKSGNDIDTDDADIIPIYDEEPMAEEAAKFVGDVKSLAKEADDSLAKHKAMELDNEHLLKAVVNLDVMNIVQKESVIDTSDLQTELERTKERFENCIIKKETKYAKLWNDW
nr:hypothetical protein [Tanacetum cinerariifolium]